jgi:MFS family permease
MSNKELSSSDTQYLLGIEIRKGVSRSHMANLYGFTFLFMITILFVSLASALFLKLIIQVPDEHFGVINSTLQVLGKLSNIIFVLFVGALSDRFGRKLFMYGGCCGSAAALILYAYSRTIGEVIGIEKMVLVYIFYFLYQTFEAFVNHMFFVLLADYTTFRGRGKGVAYMAALMGFSVTLVLGLGFGFKLAERIPLLHFYHIGAVLFFLGAFYVWKGLVDNLPEHKDEQAHHWKTVIKEVGGAIRKVPGLGYSIAALVGSGANTIILSTFFSIWCVQAATDFGLSPKQGATKSFLLMAAGALTGLIMTPIWGVIVDKWGRRGSLMIGLLTSGIFYGAVAFIANPFGGLIIFFNVMGSVGGSSVVVAARTLLIDLTPRNRMGSVMSVQSLLNSLGGMLLAWSGGLLFDYVGYSLPIAMIGVFDLLLLVWGLVIWKKIPAQTHKADYSISPHS